jgi:hypothetical protein
MFARSVSPIVVRLAGLPLACLLYIPLMPVERVFNQLLIRLFGLDRNFGFPFFFFAAYFILSGSLIPKALSCLGIQVRSRSVERLRAAGREREDEVTDELPIRIERGGLRLVGVVRVLLLLGGLAFLVLAVCLMFTWFPPPHAGTDATVPVLGLLGMSVMLLGGAFLTRYSRPELLCEISEKGIRAPDGLWGRQTLVPWEELARCEIIHDDERIWYDHFVLWDWAGRRRFRSCKTWLGQVRRSDRARILRALRSRFAQKEKSDPTAEPALVHQASAAVWDRELDG